MLGGATQRNPLHHGLLSPASSLAARPSGSCVAADFSKNGIGPEGASQLCAVLANNSALLTLLLDTNGLGDEGAAMLATVRGGTLRSRAGTAGGSGGRCWAQAGRAGSGSTGHCWGNEGLLAAARHPATLSKPGTATRSQPQGCMVPAPCPAVAGGRKPHHHPQPLLQQHRRCRRQGAGRDAQGGLQAEQQPMSTAVPCPCPAPCCEAALSGLRCSVKGGSRTPAHQPIDGRSPACPTQGWLRGTKAAWFPPGPATLPLLPCHLPLLLPLSLPPAAPTLDPALALNSPHHTMTHRTHADTQTHPTISSADQHHPGGAGAQRQCDRLRGDRRHRRGAHPEHHAQDAGPEVRARPGTRGRAQAGNAGAWPGGRACGATDDWR